DWESDFCHRTPDADGGGGMGNLCANAFSHRVGTCWTGDCAPGGFPLIAGRPHCGPFLTETHRPRYAGAELTLLVGSGLRSVQTPRDSALDGLAKGQSIS